MAELLNAPCVFCGYNGERYWQSGTHEKSCPWHDVSTPTDRLWRVREEITRLRGKPAEVEGQEPVATLTVNETTMSASYHLDPLSVLPIGEHSLYTHPAPAKVPDILFDGYAVYQALDEGKARQRTSPENVSDVLDAVVRLLKSQGGGEK